MYVPVTTRPLSSLTVTPRKNVTLSAPGKELPSSQTVTLTFYYPSHENTETAAGFICSHT